MEGTICKQFVMSVKNRKNLKPCREFKSFRSLAFRIRFLKKCIFGSSNPSTRRKIENGSIDIRKKLGSEDSEPNFASRGLARSVFARRLNTAVLQAKPQTTPRARGTLCLCAHDFVVSPAPAKQKNRLLAAFLFVLPFQNRSAEQVFRNRSVFQGQRIDFPLGDDGSKK